jgi:hypothetical protein
MTEESLCHFSSVVKLPWESHLGAARLERLMLKFGKLPEPQCTAAS